ncbi:MAG: ABC-F family ATP-binding cassette domain-containing protein [Filimonas sp.]|nr:ABC-F family ATP-binding cassette domain-containing protein [Filimonas sp.]
MLILQNVVYAHPNKDLLFDNINLIIHTQDKIALIGNNGAGKSTLLHMIAGNLLPQAGTIKTDVKPYYVPQHFGQYNHCTVAKALQVADKLSALHAILNGDVTAHNMTVLDDDWSIEERCQEALAHWGLDDIDLFRPMAALSGGQKTKVFLAGIAIHRPGLVLLDEPSNHLDAKSRQVLYNYIQTTNDTLIVVSHDRTLLNLLNSVYELSKRGVTVYGGNYTFYAEQKAVEANALTEELKSKEKALRKAKEVERDAMERQQKLDARGKKKQEKAGLPTILMNTLRNSAEKSTAKMKDVHAGKISAISGEVNQLRKELPEKDKMRIGFDNAALHKGKILIMAKEINYRYGEHWLWPAALSFQVTSGQRIALKGGNGTGKTTLIRLMLGDLQPATGTMDSAVTKAIYIDQEYSLINNTLTVYEQLQQYNEGYLQEHELKSKLTHFLFTRLDWDKSCAVLSGGEKMRLVLCCLTVSRQSPDMIILDEPTNNLDIQNISILTDAISEYEGTLIVVSHDAVFLEEVGVQEEIVLAES